MGAGGAHDALALTFPGQPRRGRCFQGGTTCGKSAPDAAAWAVRWLRRIASLAAPPALEIPLTEREAERFSGSRCSATRALDENHAVLPGDPGSASAVANHVTIHGGNLIAGRAVSRQVPDRRTLMGARPGGVRAGVPGRAPRVSPRPAGLPVVSGPGRRPWRRL